MRTYRLAWVTLVATFVLILAGGMVHSTGSALACPDWPLCYGSAMPTMEKGVFYEHGHRLIAGLVGLLTAALSAALLTRWKAIPVAKLWGWIAYGAIVIQVSVGGRLGVIASQAKAAGGTTELPWGILGFSAAIAVFVLSIALWLGKRTQDHLPTLGLVMGEIVVFQALLGGITVLQRLPTAISSTHLATAMLFLCMTVFILFKLRPTKPNGSPLLSRGLLLTATVGVYIQILLGALVRHTGSGLACNVDIFLCDGSLLPTTGPGWVLTTHRLGALVVTGLVIAATLKPLRLARQQGRALVRSLSIAAHVLVVTQVTLGLLTVLTYIHAHMATSHLVVGAALLANMAALYFAAGPLGDVQPSSPAHPKPSTSIPQVTVS